MTQDTVFDDRLVLLQISFKDAYGCLTTIDSNVRIKCPSVPDDFLFRTSSYFSNQHPFPHDDVLFFHNDVLFFTTTSYLSARRPIFSRQHPVFQHDVLFFRTTSYLSARRPIFSFKTTTSQYIFHWRRRPIFRYDVPIFQDDVLFFKTTS